MSSGAFILGVLFLTVVAPLWLVFHYITKWRAQKTLSASDEQLMAELWETMRRLEGRVVNLERILKDDRPEGRV